MPLGRGVSDVLREDVGIGKFHLLGEGVVRAQGGEEGGGGQSAQREQCRPVEKLTAVDLAVGVVVVELEQFRGKVFGSETFHGFAPIQASDCPAGRG
ncbi:hypothetical protein D3C80_1494560 [compost metagenome]